MTMVLFALSTRMQKMTDLESFHEWIRARKESAEDALIDLDEHRKQKGKATDLMQDINLYDEVSALVTEYLDSFPCS